MARALPEERIELRLALVCYGGVSLAVYMHGVTKELHKLVQASRKFDDIEDLDAKNPFAEDDSAGAYFEALRDIAGKAAASRSRSTSSPAPPPAASTASSWARCWPAAARRRS